MKLWDKESKTADKIEAFTIGDDLKFDTILAKYDVLGSKAHATMLGHVGIITNDEALQLNKVLDQLLIEIEEGKFEIEAGFEDIHSFVEHRLTQTLGEIGKKIHTGRSRNDQVLVDLHLYFKDELINIKELVHNVFKRLMTLSDQHREAKLPGYTHLQVAMPSSFGLWFAAYAELLIDDIHFLNAAYKTVNQNPLGSAAGFGSTFPLNRQLTTELLGFETLKYNSVAAQLSRGKTEKSMAFSMSSLAGTISKFCMDATLYMSQNFGFIGLPEELTTGSSIMPHKKNPDVFELIRGKCNIIQVLPTEIQLLTNNLPSGYHRDFQLLKEGLFPAIESLKDCLDILDFMLDNIIVNKKVIADEKYDLLYSVEAVNELVIKGHPFREAYKIVGKSIKDGTYQVNNNFEYTHEGSINNLCNDDIIKKMELAINGFD